MTTATMNKTQDVTATTDAPTTDALATRGTKVAARFLERQGYDILELGWQCKSGSADLIATDNGDLVFVEVRMRSNEDRGTPEDVIGKNARKRNERIAIDYLATHDICDVKVRFDVISILVVFEDRAFLWHHMNAMSIDG